MTPGAETLSGGLVFLASPKGSLVCSYLVVVGFVLRVPCSNWKFEALQTPLTAMDFKGFRTFLLHFSISFKYHRFPFQSLFLSQRGLTALCPYAALSEKNVLELWFLSAGLTRGVLWLRRKETWLASPRLAQH